VGNPVLKKAIGRGRLMVRKKVIPDMVRTPAGWAFKNLPFYINVKRKRTTKNVNAAEGIPT
jgi:hypothetical protein